MSSSLDNNLKLWRINDWECLLNIENVNKAGNLWSASFLIFNDQIYILTSNYLNQNPEKIKVYNLNGIKIKEINSKDEISYIDIYYDNYSSKPYILTGSRGFDTSYDYIDNKIYHLYKDEDEYMNIHFSLRIINIII